MEEVVSQLGPQPPNFENIVAINRGPLMREGVEAHPLAPRQVEQRAGALLVDVRTALQFDDAHIPGAVCITMLRAGFGSKLAWLADQEQEVIFIGRDDADGQRAADLAAAIGLRHIAGFLHGGMTAWREEKRGVTRTERQTLEQFHERWEASGQSLQVLDVRERAEWDAGHIPGSVHEPYHDIEDVPEGLDGSPPHRRRLRLGRARRGRREPAPAPGGRRGHPRGRGRRAALDAQGLARGRAGRHGGLTRWAVRPAADHSSGPHLPHLQFASACES